MFEAIALEHRTTMDIASTRNPSGPVTCLTYWSAEDIFLLADSGRN
jgi:hypothetical protein